jgi:hypothetical protein
MAHLELVGHAISRMRGAPERIVGREAERAAVSAFLDAVPAGPAGLLLEGEAGIGKTTLWMDALSKAGERSFRILSCRAAEAEAPLSFTALGDLLDGLDGPMGLLPAPQGRALDIALLRAEVDGPAPEQRTVSVAVLSLLRILAAEGPVLVAVDDAQWLDRPSARVLEFALRRLDRAPVGVLSAVRTGEGGRLRFWEGLGFPVVRLEVGPLSLADVDALLGGRGAVLPPSDPAQGTPDGSREPPLRARGRRGGRSPRSQMVRWTYHPYPGRPPEADR